MQAKQYETVELSYKGPEPTQSEVAVSLEATFVHALGEVRVKGFYAGNGMYKVRFLPERTGTYRYSVSGHALPQPVKGTVEVSSADARHCGLVRAEGTHLRHADGTDFHSFGTTVYALAHQSNALIEETLQSLTAAPFNKIRTCLFPKHYNYNFNEPPYYPFRPKAGTPEKEFNAREFSIFPEKRVQPDAYWDVHHPDFAFWDRFEKILLRLQEMGLEVDLILFHPYDRWGFSNLTREDNLTYLDYLLRRFSAFPNLWWSLANEYDLCFNKTAQDWEAIEAFVAENDPYHHLLSNHNCFRMWDAGRENITHVSWQTGQHYRVAELMRRYGKPVLIDECRYEGNVPEFWGNLSGQDMTRKFWRVTAQGGYCTHGETYLPGTAQAEGTTRTDEEDVVWWAKGGVLQGESPSRISFLRGIIESLPGPLEPMNGMGDFFGKNDEEMGETLRATPEEMRPFFSAIAAMDRRERDFFFADQFTYAGHFGDEAFLYYLDDQCCARFDCELSESDSYRVEVIDTWEMTRQTVSENARGKTSVKLPGKPFMAVLAVRRTRK